MDAIDSGEALTDMLGVFVFAPELRFEKFYGTITCEVYLLGELFQRLIETSACVGVHDISEFVRWQYLREADALLVDVGEIVGVVFDVVSRASYGHLVDDFVTYFVVYLIDFSCYVGLVSFAHQFVIFLDDGREERLEIWYAVDGAALAVLEEQQQIEKIVGTVVEGRCR